jgi:hypothetical protein
MGFKTWKTKDFGIMVRSGNLGIGNVANLSKDVSSCGSLSKYCREFCYMGSAHYKSMAMVTNAHKRNTDIFKEIDERGLWASFVFDMSQLIQAKNLPLFRVDVNGDLVSKNELDAWMAIACRCPDTKFWIPTKRFYWLDKYMVDRIKAIDNLSVSVSVFFNMPSAIKDRAHKTGLPIAYTDSENVHKYKACSKPCETCRWCFDQKKNVFLPIHGTEAVKKRREYYQDK